VTRRRWPGGADAAIPGAGAGRAVALGHARQIVAEVPACCCCCCRCCCCCCCCRCCRCCARLHPRTSASSDSNLWEWGSGMRSVTLKGVRLMRRGACGGEAASGSVHAAPRSRSRSRRRCWWLPGRVHEPPGQDTPSGTAAGHGWQHCGLPGAAAAALGREPRAPRGQPRPAGRPPPWPAGTASLRRPPPLRRACTRCHPGCLRPRAPRRTTC
jgi:hypothetical protein